MKRTIKLRDMTEKQYKKFNCTSIDCCECPFKLIACPVGHYCWLDHKDLFSDKFLDQEVEIEVPDILDKEEHDYLEAVIKPWRDKVMGIQKWETPWRCNEFIVIEIGGDGSNVNLPRYPIGTMYKGMEAEKWYTLEELGL